jgi:hypothetical protein
MSNITVPGAAFLPDGGQLWKHSGNAVSNVFSMTTTWGTHAVLLGFDVTASGSQPDDCHCTALVAGSMFYYNGQQTGIENGVSWAWRGQIPFLPDEQLRVQADCATTISWGGVMWGYLYPRPNFNF